MKSACAFVDAIEPTTVTTKSRMINDEWKQSEAVASLATRAFRISVKDAQKRRG